MFKRVRGYDVPADDTECIKVVFDTVKDLKPAYELCRKFNVAVQAGGNFGVWAAELSKRFATVYTFEPDPLNFAALCRNIGDNQKIIKLQAGLGHIGFCTDMHRNPKNAGAHYVEGFGVLPIIRLDSLGITACDLIVLDIEGMELLALRGAAHTIKEFKPVIHLEDKGLSEKFGNAKGEAEKWLATFGYKVRARPHRDVILSC